MTERAVLYQLTHKFLHREQDIPEGPRQVIYYSLAIGHHVGVMDCFQSVMELPLEDYRRWLGCIPEGTGHRKLAGLLKWGEIELNCEHAKELLPLLQNTLAFEEAAEAQWTEVLIDRLKKMIDEPAMYLMVRKLT